MKPGTPLDPFSKALILHLWADTLSQIGEARFDAAFHKVLLTSTYRPDIAEIRRFAGIVTEVPVEREALDALSSIFQAMRVHGFELKEKLGKVISERDSLGHCLAHYNYIREPKIPAPVFSDVTEASIAKLGHGDRASGLKAIGEHPAMDSLALARAVGMGRDIKVSARTFGAKLEADIEKKWIRVYMLCKG